MHLSCSVIYLEQEKLILLEPILSGYGQISPFFLSPLCIAAVHNFCLELLW